jgi:hypothetical protein
MVSDLGDRFITDHKTVVPDIKTFDLSMQR